MRARSLIDMKRLESVFKNLLWKFKMVNVGSDNFGKVLRKIKSKQMFRFWLFVCFLFNECYLLKHQPSLLTIKVVGKPAKEIDFR